MNLIVEAGYIKGLVIYNKTIEMNVPIENYTFDYCFIVDKRARTIDESSINVFVYTSADEATVYDKDGEVLEVVETDPTSFDNSAFDFEHGGVHLSTDRTFATTVESLSDESGYAKGSSNTSIIDVTATGTIESDGTITGVVVLQLPVIKGDIIYFNASNYSNLRYDTDNKEVQASSNVWEIKRSGIFKISSTGDAKIDYIGIGVQEG